jgi:aminomethyltransferase
VRILIKNIKETPLFEIHKKYGGKIVNFAGWVLPVQYSGIIEEHLAVREKCGIFDVSHMGEILVEGDEAEEFIQRVITNNIEGVDKHKILYSPMCYENGGTVDDVLIYKYNEKKYLFIVNAANINKDYEWLIKNSDGNVTIDNVSEEYAQIALQGPKSEEVLQKVCDFNLKDLKFYYFNPEVKIENTNVIVSRTGYTGEDGFEIYTRSENAESIWEMLILAGKEEGIMPCGLGCRDTLRFEACLPLYGHELSETVSPIEAGLSSFVKFNKNEFIGKEALEKQNRKPERTIVGFEMVDRGIARKDYLIEKDGKEIGVVTSGSFAPSLNKNLGLALIQKEYSEIEEEIEILIRNKKLKAKIINKPFYSKKYNK